MTDEVDDVLIEEEDGEGSTGTPEQKLKALREKLKAAQGEAAENLAGWQRAKADYVNLSKRLREADEAMGRAGVALTVAQLIPVFDSIEASKHDATLKQLDATLQKLGIERYRPEDGSKFDPTKSEAVSTVATDDASLDNTIHSVMQSGYAEDGVAIRPARVTVYHKE